MSGVVISTVDRIVATAWIVLLGGISLFVLRRKAAQPDLSEMECERVSTNEHGLAG